MIIGGLQKTSFVDWPGKICSIVFIAGCNLRCGFCHNPELVDPELIERLEALSENELLTALVGCKKYIDGVCISGGEPLLSPDVVRLIRKIKDKGLAIKLDTNGTVPKMLKSLLDERLIDYVAMDIKGPKDRYEEICNVKVNVELIEESIKIIKESGVDHEFRTTVVKGLLGPEDIKSIGKWIKGADAYFLQSFVSDSKTLDPEWKGKKTWSPDQLREMEESIKIYFRTTGVRGV